MKIGFDGKPRRIGGNRPRDVVRRWGCWLLVNALAEVAVAVLNAVLLALGDL